MSQSAYSDTGWRRLIGSPKLQIIFHTRATKYRSLLRKMTYKDKGSYESSPPCISVCALAYERYVCVLYIWRVWCIYTQARLHKKMHTHTYIYIYIYSSECFMRRYLMRKRGTKILHDGESLQI